MSAAVAAASASRAAPTPGSGPADAVGPSDTQLHRLLADLAQTTEEAAGDARRLALDHPLVVVSAAFLLGLAVGAAWRGR